MDGIQKVRGSNPLTSTTAPPHVTLWRAPGALRAAPRCAALRREQRIPEQSSSGVNPAPPIVIAVHPPEQGTSASAAPLDCGHAAHRPQSLSENGAGASLAAPCFLRDPLAFFPRLLAAQSRRVGPAARAAPTTRSLRPPPRDRGARDPPIQERGTRHAGAVGPGNDSEPLSAPWAAA